MNLLSGLEQFGMKVDDEADKIFAEEKKKTRTPVRKEPVKANTEKELSETDFLFTKHVRCTICEKVFETKMVKNARIKRLQPDFDLRPRFQNIDTLKYDVYSCPYCGYSAMSRYFEHLTKGQINLVKENVCTNFKPKTEEEPETFDYETAIARYKLALYNSIVKRAKASEKAYTCLKISWLYRSWGDEMPENTKEEQEKKAEIRKLQEEFYKEAYDGFQKALANEDFPICGMDSFTMDYLMACLAFHFKQYSYASKSISNILLSPVADRRMKDRALELKSIIVEEIKKNNANQ